MIPLRKALFSSVGKKFIVGLTGLGLVLFIVNHLLANLLLLQSSGQAYNLYVKKLHDFGAFLTIAELGLAACFIIHIIFTVQVTWNSKKARPENYARYESKGKPSKNS